MSLLLLTVSCGVSYTHCLLSLFSLIAMRSPVDRASNSMIARHEVLPFYLVVSLGSTDNYLLLQVFSGVV